jgi:hypothetical protein
LHDQLRLAVDGQHQRMPGLSEAVQEVDRRGRCVGPRPRTTWPPPRSTQTRRSLWPTRRRAIRRR